MGISEALILSQTTTIYEACCAMALHRADVLVVTNSNELLTGILTNKDIVKTVIASEIDLLNTPVSKVMSNNPSCVMFDTLFVDTLKKMEYKGFTQLPVIQKNGKVTGLFYNTGVSTMTYYEKVLEVAAQGSAPRGLKMKQMPLEHALMVPETTTIYEACCRMAVGKFEVVVLTDSDGLLMGILTKKVSLQSSL
ncbi:CBS domain-containing protein CBSCBSPB5 [Lactuca sativa]|uniref:CBS domain-containing protein CBSCBSPB5 n=1 Tax=Lactuca sativa TaxID=4236 RepID=UPI0022AF970D|nr:CBS domain-containing protein CBSCBSPB5 [Lactuca sativa]